MKQTKPMATLAEIELDARRLQGIALAAMFSAIATRLRAIFVAAPMNTETGKTA